MTGGVIMGGLECAAVWREEYLCCFLTSRWDPVVNGVHGKEIPGLKINHWTVFRQVHVLVLRWNDFNGIRVQDGLWLGVLIVEVHWVEFLSIRTHHGVLERKWRC